MQKRLIKDDKTLFLIFSLLLVFASSLILKNILETKTPKSPELYPVSTENQAYFEIQTDASTLPAVGEQVKVTVNLATHPNDSYYSAAVVLQWDESILEYAGKGGHTSQGNFIGYPLAGDSGKYIFLFLIEEENALSHASTEPEKFTDVTFNVLDNTRDANISISLSETAVQLTGNSGSNSVDQSLSTSNSVQISSADQNIVINNILPDNVYVDQPVTILGSNLGSQSDYDLAIEQGDLKEKICSYDDTLVGCGENNDKVVMTSLVNITNWDSGEIEMSAQANTVSLCKNNENLLSFPISGKIYLSDKGTTQVVSNEFTGSIQGCTQSLDPQEICDQGGGTWKIDFPNACKDTCEYAQNPDITCAQVTSEGCDCGPNLCWNTNAQQCESYVIKDVCGPNADLNADGECECEVPFDNCDHDWSNGCEVDLRTYQRNG